MNDGHDNIPSLDDAVKQYENTNNTNNITTEPKVEEVSNKIEPITEPKKVSLMDLMDQEHQKACASAPPKDTNFYLECFIGSNYNQFVNGGISDPYLFFGEYYLIYRKMYVPALIKYLISVVLLFIMLMARDNSNNKIVLLCFGIIMALQILPIFFVKRFYYNYALRKVNKILIENKGKSEVEIANICEKKGGTSKVSIIILLILLIIVKRAGAYFGQTTATEFSCRNLHSLSTSYLKMGGQSYDNYDILVKNACAVSIKTKRATDNSKVRIIDDNNSFTEKIKINDYEWFHMKNESEEIYISQYLDYIYTIRVVNLNNSNNCKKSIDTLINNMKFYR